MSSAQSQPASSQQQQKEVRKPPFANWPTIKILTPPQGQFSLQKDEWCVTYCSQSVTGRIHGKEPYCRSLCVRKVFPYEVKNILAFKRHKALDSNGKAIYPLPAEGQAANLPRMLGGRPPEDPEDSNYKHRAPEPPKSWDEGLYLWTGKGRLAAHEKMDSMSMDFERQRRVAAMREKRREVWQDYENTIRQQKSNDASTQDRIWVPNIPPRPLPDISSKAILVSLPPDFPSLFERINKLLAPSFKVLNITYDSFKSGEQKAFARRVWDMAWTKEPFQLASKSFAHAYERWKDKDEAADEEDDKKNSS
ncbi:hypothetical protein AGABI2DRAFT_192757 [Agaricus bisporus var. bisporus H97]|uniref:hypothetical protein n=1 Tax=Agaricus bisporus var. bisporus (strain H97 / ATCC MYA-4626 / FGSC 10389) TaxID=936046 RepID=UPI00029F5311|nr:hypothetical protein AGABI2DRAFT_192757 [Agaricus bisporus var. bisporus H97]EKV47573.1 hypothetical protein AGABI2DRAFT_192757 [Agaricus bisporus var. bisporus H97]